MQSPGKNGEGKSTSATLLDGLSSQHSESWDRLVDKYGPLVCFWCRRYGLQPADVEDVLQEVFSVVLRRVPDFKRGRRGSFRAWLWGITRNKLGDFMRRSAKQPQIAGSSLIERSAVPINGSPTSIDVLAGNSSIVPFAKSSYCYSYLLRMVEDEFEPKSWQAFYKVVCEGHAPSDVAATLGLTVNAVYVAKSRILRRLRETLETLESSLTDGSEQDFF